MATIKKDCEMLKRVGIDFVFVPLHVYEFLTHSPRKAESKKMVCMTVTINMLLFFLHHVVQTSDMRQDLYNEFVTAVEGQLGFAAPANAGGRSRDTKEDLW